MYRKLSHLFIALMLSLTIPGFSFAQSAAKSGGSSNRGQAAGSSSRYQGSGSSSRQTSAAAKKEMRMIAKEEAKLVREITKSEFNAIKLDRDQRSALKGLVHENFDAFMSLEKQMAMAIPAEKASKIRNAYLQATRKGASKSEAMMSSMKKAEVETMVQDKVMMLGEQREKMIMDISANLKSSLDEEQKMTLAKMEEEKKGAMSKEDSMADDAGDKKMKEMDDSESVEKAAKSAQPEKNSVSANNR